MFYTARNALNEVGARCISITFRDSREPFKFYTPQQARLTKTGETFLDSMSYGASSKRTYEFCVTGCSDERLLIISSDDNDGDDHEKVTNGYVFAVHDMNLPLSNTILMGFVRTASDTEVLSVVNAHMLAIGVKGYEPDLCKANFLTLNRDVSTKCKRVFGYNSDNEWLEIERLNMLTANTKPMVLPGSSFVFGPRHSASESTVPSSFSSSSFDPKESSSSASDSKESSSEIPITTTTTSTTTTTTTTLKSVLSVAVQQPYIQLLSKFLDVGTVVITNDVGVMLMTEKKVKLPRGFMWSAREPNGSVVVGCYSGSTAVLPKDLKVLYGLSNLPNQQPLAIKPLDFPVIMRERGSDVIFGWKEVAEMGIKMKRDVVRSEMLAGGFNEFELSYCGRRLNNEDLILSEPDTGLFAVFDGHGGIDIAEFLQNGFRPKVGDDLVKYCVDIDEAILKIEMFNDMGSCAIFAMFQPFIINQTENKQENKDNEEKHDIEPVELSSDGTLKILLEDNGSVPPTGALAEDASKNTIPLVSVTVGSVGDSSAMLLHGDGTFDVVGVISKPNNPCERDRIKKAGNCVSWDRVGGTLSVSRAFGDSRYKSADKIPMDRAVSAIPILRSFTMCATDRLLMFSDGLTECLTLEVLFIFIIIVDSPLMTLVFRSKSIHSWSIIQVFLVKNLSDV